MTKYKEIQINAPDYFKLGADPWPPTFDKPIAEIKAAIAAGQVPFIRPTAALPAHFTRTHEPAYESFERGCGNLRARGFLRVDIVANSSGTGAPAPDQNTDRARVVRVAVSPGQTIRLDGPGVMLRSPSGYFAGVPGGTQTKYGVLRDLESKGSADRPRVSLDGGFFYAANPDAPIGAHEEIVFLLIDPKTWGQPFDSLPYFDGETHDYCALGKVPALDKGELYAYGAILAAALKPYKDKIAFWCAPVNEPEYRLFWPRRLREEDNAPDLDALQDEVLFHFMRGVKHSLGNIVQGGPDTGSPDVLQWWLNLPRTGVEVVTFHAYNWAGEQFPDGITSKLDNWLKPQLEAVGWSGKVFITELGGLSSGKGAIGSGVFGEKEWQAVLPILKARPWITAAYNPLTRLVETP